MADQKDPTTDTRGKYVDGRGYVLVYVGYRSHHPLADKRGYVYEHRLVMAEAGHVFTGKDEVHHRNGDPGDNRLENLEVFPGHGHHMLHHRKNLGRRKPQEPNPEILCACGCEGRLKKFDDYGRPRRHLPHHHNRKTR